LERAATPFARLAAFLASNSSGDSGFIAQSPVFNFTNPRLVEIGTENLPLSTVINAEKNSCQIVNAQKSLSCSDSDTLSTTT
jgi:hypothetical protein